MKGEQDKGSETLWLFYVNICSLCDKIIPVLGALDRELFYLHDTAGIDLTRQGVMDCYNRVPSLKLSNES